MAKLTMEHFEASGKWEPEKWIIDNDPLTNKNPISDFVIERENDGRLTMTIGLDAEYYRRDPEALKKVVTNLLEGNNITDYEIEQSSHRNLSSIKINRAAPGDLTRIAGALSNSVDQGNGATAYSILDKKVALQVADLEKEALGETEAFSINKMELGEDNTPYLDYESNIPGAAITMLKQDSSFAEIDGKPVKAEVTNIIIDPDSKNDVVGALTKAGIEYKAGKEVIMVSEPMAKVAQALTASGLLPKSANTEIQTALASMKQNFVTAAEVKAAGFSFTKPAPTLTGNEM